jgi:hypothetical protein
MTRRAERQRLLPVFLNVELVQDNQIKGPLLPGAYGPVDQPLEVISVDNVDVGRRLQSTFALMRRTHDNGHGQVLQVVPLLTLAAPRGLGHALRRHHQSSADHSRLPQFLDPGQSDHRFPEAL